MQSLREWLLVLLLIADGSGTIAAPEERRAGEAARGARCGILRVASAEAPVVRAALPAPSPCRAAPAATAAAGIDEARIEVAQKVKVWHRHIVHSARAKAVQSIWYKPELRKLRNRRLALNSFEKRPSYEVRA